jgi:Flp pilus assembly protein TadG
VWSWSCRRAGKRRGQATVELALVLPILAALTMGVLELGLLLNAYITVVTLGRDGSRYAVDGATNCEMRTVVHSEGTRRIGNWATNGAVLIVRGHTSKQTSGDTVGWVNPSDSTAWQVDSANPSGWTLQSQRSSIHGLTIDNSAGFEFVLVEVQYNYQTLTRMPFANNILVSTRTVTRTAAQNTNSC